MAGAGKTTKKRTPRSAALTERNKLRQKKARDRKALKRLGQAAQKRLKKRAWLKENRLLDPSFARKLPTPEPKIVHTALNKDTRGIDQVIYSVLLTPHRD